MAAELQPTQYPVSNHPVQPTLPAAPTTVAPKRHRRPSVRLGDIGDQPATLRTAKPWRINPNKSSKSRPLTNLATGYFNPNTVFSADTATPITSNNNNGNSHRKDFKSWRTTTGAKRVRTTNFTIDEPQPEPGEEDREESENGNNKDNAAFDNDDEEGVRYFDSEGLEQEEEPQSPLHSANAWHGHNRSSFRGVSDSHPEFPESDSRSRGAIGDIGLRTWLVGLGLGRYVPVFEIHEVDDEVLPHLTLQDLKDMGINAVGSRRKLYYAIQKLPKGFSPCRCRCIGSVAADLAHSCSIVMLKISSSLSIGGFESSRGRQVGIWNKCMPISQFTS